LLRKVDRNSSLVVRGTLPNLLRGPVFVVGHVGFKSRFAEMSSILAEIIIHLYDRKNDVHGKELVPCRVVDLSIFEHAC